MCFLIKAEQAKEKKSRMKHLFSEPTIEHKATKEI